MPGTSFSDRSILLGPVPTLFILVLWTLIVAAMGYWLFSEHRRDIDIQARQVAELSIDKDIAYRRWAALHGGVFVPVSPDTPPNPHLLGRVPERDIVTPGGRSLTLVNPAYMTRQVYELIGQTVGLSGQQVALIGHLTSLRPLRPENAPDPWERKALESFEQRVQSVAEEQDYLGQRVLRMMKPFQVEKACLTCHGQQGYREGEIRGGISVAVPLAPLQAAETAHLGNLLAVLMAFWLVGCACLLLARKLWGERLNRKLNVELQALVASRTAELEEKNAALDRFSHVVAHDLRAPLITISSFAEILSREKGIVDHADNRQFLEHIDNAARRMNTFIVTLLNYASLGREPPRLVAVALGEILANVSMALAGSIAEQRAKLVVPTGAPVVRSDVELLYQVFLNLVQNGIKYARCGVPPVIDFSWRREDDRIVVEVSDNGRGIAPADQERIFEPFVQSATGEGGGYGIGLAAVRKALRLMGGDIVLQSSTDHGSTFAVSLPASLPG